MSTNVAQSDVGAAEVTQGCAGGGATRDTHLVEKVRRLAEHGAALGALAATVDEELAQFKE